MVMVGVRWDLTRMPGVLWFEHVALEMRLVRRILQFTRKERNKEQWSGVLSE